MMSRWMLPVVALAAQGCLVPVLTVEVVDDDTTSSSSSSSTSSGGEQDFPPTVEVYFPLRPGQSREDKRILGPGDTIEVSARDDVGLRSVMVRFAQAVTFVESGTSAHHVVPVEVIGGGYGAMQVMATDSAGAATWRTVTNLLVDLTAPSVRLLSSNIVRADGEGPYGVLKVWVGDAWLLRSAMLRIGDETWWHTFEMGRDTQLGVEWDSSWVEFDARLLPPGRHEALIRAQDWVDNVAEVTTEVLVDAAAPGVKLLRPQAGEVFTDVLPVEALVEQDDESPAFVEISVNGTIVAQAGSGAVMLELAATDFATGPASVEAVGVDLVGNRSAPEKVEVVIVRP